MTAPRPPDAAVEAALRSLHGDAQLVSRRTLPYRSSYPLELLTVRFSDGQREMVLKRLGGQPSADSTWEMKPAFVRDPLREIEVYRDLLAPWGCSAPEYLGSVIDARRGRYWLFLGHVPGDPLWQRGEIEVWLEAARWLAALHSTWSERRLEHAPRLLRHDAPYYRRWLLRARRFSSAEDVAILAAPFGVALDWLDSQPTTLLHGEFYPSNVVVDHVVGGPRIHPLDWEMAGIGPGAIDLAALVTGWEEDDRVAMAAAYRQALPPATRPALDELLIGLDHCRLLLAVQWLGWSARWAPPPHQARDWLATALEIGGAS